MTDTQQERDVQWLSEALSTAFAHPDAGPVPKVAWQEVVPILDVRSARNQRELAAWTEHMRLLRKREAMLAAELQQQRGSDALPRGGGAPRELLQDQKALEQPLGQLAKQMWAEIAAVKQAVGAVNQMVSHAGPGPGQGFVLGLASAVDKADRALGDLKRQQAAAYRSLMEQEGQLEDELEELAAGLEQEVTEGIDTGHGHGAEVRRRSDVGAGPPAKPHVQPRPRAVSAGGGGCLAPEVAEFEDFVARHGESGGWQREDHEEFVRLVKGCGGDYVKAVAMCMERVIGYSRAEVMQHATWHMDYMDLLVRKRTAIAQWREARERERAQQLAQAALLDSDAADVAEEEKSRAARHAALLAREKQVQKQMVAQWREAQEEQRREKDRAAAETRRRVEERARLDKEERQAANKHKLELHHKVKSRMARQAHVHAALEAAATEQQAAEAAADPQQAMRVQHRNTELLRRRHALVVTKEEARAQRAVVQERLLSRPGVQVQGSSDPSRLLRGTQVHMQRVAAVREQGQQPKDSGFILKVSHLAVPSWRAGMQ